MTDPVNVFIPAAGLGERLRPITFHIPKPLLPVAGKPLLEIVLERISLLPVKHIGINLHHKGDVVESWIRSSAFSDRIISFPEERLLGTGGALKNAQRLLSEGTFLVHNADILSEIDLEGLIAFHRSSGNMATLALLDFPKLNTVAVGSDGLVKGVGDFVGLRSFDKGLTFTGVAVYEPGFLGFLPEGVSSVVDAWIAAISARHRIGAFDVSGCYWTDMGSASAYANAVVNKLRSEGESVHIDPSVAGCRDAEMDGFVVMEGKSDVGKGASLRNCILLPGSLVEGNASLENFIGGPGFTIPLSEKEFSGDSGDGHLFLIGTGGSDRKYYRIRNMNGSSVLVRYGRDDRDFPRHLAYSEFLGRCGIPVPNLLTVDREKREAVFEDLGDISLYSWLKCGRAEDEVETMYAKVVDIAVMIHREASAQIEGCPLLRERIFDYDHLRWETRYFMENFALRIKEARGEDAALLEKEFHRLAARADSFPKTVMHRDFQSQNIMITRGGIPRVIDYQGARIGPPAYDLVSLLWDPYYRLEERLRERLLSHYIGGMKGRGGADFDERTFRDSLLPCRLQRHMQALGAYGFLSSVKGKKYFLKHAAEGLRLLKEDVSAARTEYPALYEMVVRCNQRRSSLQ